MKSLFLLFFMVHCMGAHAKGVTEQTLREMISFIETWSGYSYDGQDLPEVRSLNDQWLQMYYYGDYEYAQAEFHGVELPLVNAYYEPKDQIIYISDRIALDSEEVLPTLVHELVHYMQDINGYTESVGEHLACTESEAYDIQMLWQIENNFRVDQVDAIREQSLFSAMNCMGNQFDY